MALAYATAPAAPARHFLGVERSVCGRAWRDRLDERGVARALSIAQRHGLPELLARMLAGRGVEIDEVESFLDPTVKRLMPDPHALTAMQAAAERIADAIQRGERIAIFGDYDVDGATSAALLARYLRHCGAEPFIHIPDRLFEGYGPNVEAVRALAERGAKLLITVDCGTTSIEPLEEAAPSRRRRRGHRSSSMRRAAAASGRHRQSQPARRSLQARASRGGRARVPHHRRGQPRAAPPRLLVADARPSPISSARSTSSRSAPSPTWCRSRASTAPSSPKACSPCAGATMSG